MPVATRLTCPPDTLIDPTVGWTSGLTVTLKLPVALRLGVPQSATLRMIELVVLAWLHERPPGKDGVVGVERREGRVGRGIEQAECQCLRRLVRVGRRIGQNQGKTRVDCLIGN